VAVDEFGESVLGAVLGITPEQFPICVAHVQKYIAAKKGNPTENFVGADVRRLILHEEGRMQNEETKLEPRHLSGSDG
jgi:hypothetical protein